MASKFPATRESIFLNNAGITLMSNPVKDALDNFNENYYKYGFDFLKKHLNLADELRLLIAPILNCEPEEIALTHNTAEGMNFIAQGYQFSKGDNIIVMEKEYPSNVYPWLNLKSKGVEVRFLKPENGLFTVDNLMKIVDENTKLVSFSFVHWIYGSKTDINKIGEFCKNRDIIFVLDGAQGVGLCPINVKEANVQALSMPAWKWLTGPLGLGVFYCSKNFINKLDLVMTGTTAYENFMDFFNYSKPLFKDARRFEYSTKSVLDLIYFQASLKFLKEFETEKIYNYVLNIIDGYAEKLLRKGYKIITPLDDKQYRSGIINFHHPKFETKKLADLLSENNINAPIRDNGIRISPYIYNTFEEINQVMDILY